MTERKKTKRNVNLEILFTTSLSVLECDNDYCKSMCENFAFEFKPLMQVLRVLLHYCY